MGLFSFPDPANWHALGFKLGLAPYAPSAGYCSGVSFRRVKRARGVPAGAKPCFTHWFHGLRRGCEVFVLQYTTGSGSSTTTWTAALARIDPPLFLGLTIRQHGLLDKIFGGKDIQVGEPTADERLDIDGFDSARIAMLLSPSDIHCREALSRMTALTSQWTLYVGDSVVEVARADTITDLAEMTYMLDSAIDLAVWFAARRRVVPMSQGELAQQEAWSQFAQRSRLAFDPPRMTISGELAGTSLDIALETDGQRTRTVVTARFPHQVHVAFTVLRTAVPGFLQGIFSQDIKVGDEAFDSMFKVTGYPEEAVRVALARPTLLQILKHLGTHAHDLQLNHQELFFRVEGATPRHADIEGLVSLACTTSGELYTAIRDLGPYR